MSEFSTKLKDCIQSQKNQLTEMQVLLTNIESSDVNRQNEQLKTELSALKLELDNLRGLHNVESRENTALRLALRDQLLSEKIGIIYSTQTKIDSYFKKTKFEVNSSLEQYRISAESSLNKIKITALNYGLQTDKEITQEIEQVKLLLNKKIQEVRASVDSQYINAREDSAKTAKMLKEENITPDQIEKRIKNNSLEAKIGIKIINWIGILIILIGVGTALRYAYANVTDLAKALSGFSLGLLFIIAGELLNRHKKNIAALGITGGGIGIMYLSLYTAYFNLHVIPNVLFALLICVAITVVAFILALRYDSAIISAFALIGGFLPVFAMELNEKSILIAMGYFFILNFYTLLVSSQKGWFINKPLSFALNVPVLIFLAFKIDNFTYALIYSFITFAMYTSITLIYPYLNKKGVSLWDNILLAANTITSCFVIYSLVETNGLSEYRGLVAVLFALVYFALAQVTWKRIADAKVVTSIFYLTALIFLVLIVPFQFGKIWLSLGWMSEALVLIIVGISNKKRLYQYAGWVIFGICSYSFLFTDLLLQVKFFEYRFLAYTLGSLIILSMYTFYDRKDNSFKFTVVAQLVKLFKYFTLLLVWSYICYLLIKIFSDYRLDRYTSFKYQYRVLIFAIVSILLATVYPKIKILADKGVVAISVIMHIIGIITCFLLNMLWNSNETTISNYSLIALIVIIVFNIVIIFSVKDILVRLFSRTSNSFELYPLLISLYFLASLTIVLIVQFDLGGQNIFFSGIYVISAFLLILYGFWKQLSFIRRFGLALSMIATTKLFIYDIALTKIEYKIISYFVFGIALVGISLMYQKFSKQFEIKNVLKEDVDIQIN